MFRQNNVVLLVSIGIALLAGLLIGGAAGMVLGYHIGNRQETKYLSDFRSPESSQVRSRFAGDFGDRTTTPMDIKNGTEMFNLFLNNPIKAESQYLGKRVQMYGYGTIARNGRGFYVSFPTASSLDGPNLAPGIIAYVERGDESDFADLRADSDILITATISTWRNNQSGAFNGIVIEMQNAKFIRAR